MLRLGAKSGGVTVPLGAPGATLFVCRGPSRFCGPAATATELTLHHPYFIGDDTRPRRTKGSDLTRAVAELGFKSGGAVSLCALACDPQPPITVTM